MTCKKNFAGHLILIELQATQKLLVCYSMYLNIKSRMCSLNSNWIIPKLPVTSFSTPSKWGILTATQGFISQRDELPNFFWPTPLPTKDDNNLQIVLTIPCQHSETKENQTIKLKVLLGSWWDRRLQIVQTRVLENCHFKFIFAISIGNNGQIMHSNSIQFTYMN